MSLTVSIGGPKRISWRALLAATMLLGLSTAAAQAQPTVSQPLDPVFAWWELLKSLNELGAAKADDARAFYQRFLANESRGRVTGDQFVEYFQGKSERSPLNRVLLGRGGTWYQIVSVTQEERQAAAGYIVSYARVDVRYQMQTGSDPQSAQYYVANENVCGENGRCANVWRLILWDEIVEAMRGGRATPSAPTTDSSSPVGDSKGDCSGVVARALARCGEQGGGKK